MSISTNIKKYREAYNLTQEELAKICGVTNKAVSTWEKGIKTPRMGSIEKMAEYFHIKLSDLIESDKDTAVAYHSNDDVFHVDDETLQILKAVNKNEDIKALLSIAKDASKQDIKQAIKVIKAITDK